MRIAWIFTVLNQFQLAVEAVASCQTSHDIDLYPILNYRHKLSLAGAWNLGIYMAHTEHEYDYYLITNDDIIFSSWTIDGLVSFFNTAPDDIVMVTGSNVRGSSTPEQIYHWPKPEENLWGENPDFSCFMIRMSTIEKVGNFDENFKPAYFEDNDYHHRVNLSGNRAVSTTLAPYYHYGSRTQNATEGFPIVPSQTFERNRDYYFRKWGGHPGREKYPTPFNDPEKTFRNW